jgi:hypothetical protein
VHRDRDGRQSRSGEKDERALRRDDLKYVRLTDGADPLYDLATDVREQADLAKASHRALRSPVYPGHLV